MQSIPFITSLRFRRRSCSFQRSLYLQNTFRIRAHADPHTLPCLSGVMMRVATFLLFTVGASAVTFDITFDLISATSIIDADSQQWWESNDMSDPFAGIFVAGRPCGLTDTIMDDHNPIWNRAITCRNVGQSETICLAIFDRDTFDGSDAGFTLEQMKTRNSFVASSCGSVIVLGVPLSCVTQFQPSCPPISLTDQTRHWAENGVTITYNLEIVANLPPLPPPPPPPAPLPPPKPVEQEILDTTRDIVSSMPKWLVITLVVIGILCGMECVYCACKKLCKDQDAPRRMTSFRSQTRPTFNSVEMTSASPRV